MAENMVGPKMPAAQPRSLRLTGYFRRVKLPAGVARLSGGYPAMSHHCPDCHRVRYNRRLKACGFCGAPTLPARPPDRAGVTAPGGRAWWDGGWAVWDRLFARRPLRSLTALTTTLAATARTASATATAHAGTTLAPLPGRALRAVRVLGDFAIAVLVEFLQGLGGLGDFLCVDDAVVVEVQCGDQRRGAHPLAALAPLAGAAGLALAGRTLQPRLCRSRSEAPARCPGQAREHPGFGQQGRILVELRHRDGQTIGPVGSAHGARGVETRG